MYYLLLGFSCVVYYQGSYVLFIIGVHLYLISGSAVLFIIRVQLYCLFLGFSSGVYYWVRLKCSLCSSSWMLKMCPPRSLLNCWKSNVDHDYSFYIFLQCCVDCLFCLLCKWTIVREWSTRVVKNTLHQQMFYLQDRSTMLAEPPPHHHHPHPPAHTHTHYKWVNLFDWTQRIYCWWWCSPF